MIEDVGFWYAAANNPDKPAIIEATGELHTFGSIAGDVNQLSRFLQGSGLSPGDHVAMALPNVPQVYRTLLACIQIGLIVTPINVHLLSDEISYVLNDSDARAFITHPSMAPFALLAAEEAGLKQTARLSFGELDGFQNLNEAAIQESIALPSNRTPGTTMFYTSGTTGRPKGVFRKGIGTDLIKELHSTVSQALLRGMNHESVHLAQGPLYHAGPQRSSYWTLHVGGTVIIGPQAWNAEEVLRLIERYGVTDSFMVATMLFRLARLSREVKAQYRVASLRKDGILLGAAACPPEVKREMIDWWGPVFLETYGGTEGHFSNIGSEEWLNHPGSVGRAEHGVSIHILDDDGHPVPSGTVGTIFGRHENQVGFDTEYYKDPEKTATARMGDYVTLGDLGYLDRDGWLFVVDRRVDMINSGGVKVYPAEVEKVLSAHPLVDDVAVVGVPNVEWGHEVVAVVKLVDSEGSKSVIGTEQELIQFVKDRIASFKAPRRIMFRSELPRSPAGKLYKRRLIGEISTQG